jgi:hypothetical protein
MFGIPRTYTYFTPEVEDLKGMKERNDAERRGGSMASPVTVKAEKSRTIKPILANANEGSGEIVHCTYSSRDAF